MAKKDLQIKYEELYGEVPAEEITVKELELAIADKEIPVKLELVQNKGRVRLGSLT